MKFNVAVLALTGLAISASAAPTNELETNVAQDCKAAGSMHIGLLPPFAAFFCFYFFSLPFYSSYDFMYTEMLTVLSAFDIAHVTFHGCDQVCCSGSCRWTIYWGICN